MADMLMYGYFCEEPLAAPTVAAGNASGDLTTGDDYIYAVTFVTLFGETAGGPQTLAFEATATGSVNLSAIPISPNTNTIARRLYRTIGDGADLLFLAQLDDNATTTYTDTTDDGDLGDPIPTVNTANSRQHVDGETTFNGPVAFEGGITMNALPVTTVETDITANPAGTQNAAYQLTAQYSIVTTAADPNASVRLPSITAAGIYVRVVNKSAEDIRVFGFGDQTIESEVAGDPIEVIASSYVELISVSDSNWQILNPIPLPP